MMFQTTKLLIVLALFALVKNDKNENIPTPPKIRTKYGNQTINRPLFHFTPEFGWMNDPNGCWFDTKDKIYHIYFQYNPNDTIWGMPLYWGHATSKDLINWEEQKIAIRAPDWAGAYSGSMFIDDECVASDWFTNSCTDEKRHNNTVAAWTWNRVDWKEYQCLSYSTDGGETFITPDTVYCPIVNESDSTQFRDPQVVKFASKQYIMSIAKSHEYSIHFYESTDLAEWKIAGGFTLYGYLGFQYECPNLIKLKNSEPESGEDPSYWVLFISINPGSQQGGSSTEYFFGQYTFGSTDNLPYKASFHYNTLMDQGKDFYAMQIMYVPPTSDELTSGFESGIGITWASNWQYSKVVPTDPWRSSMAIPRRIKLGHYNPTGSTPLLYVLSKALLDEDDMDDTKLTEPTRFETALPDFTSINNSGETYTIPGTAFGALELYIEFVSCDAYTDHAPGVITFFLRGGSMPEEYLRIGYNQKADAFFLDRGNTKVQWVHDNPFFTDKLTMTVYGTSTGITQDGIFKSTYDPVNNKYNQDYSGTCGEVKFTAHIIVDRNIVEVFFNEDNEGYSAITSTNTFFFSGGNFITDVLVDYNSGGQNNDKGFNSIKIKGRHLNLKESSSDTTDDTNGEL